MNKNNHVLIKNIYYMLSYAFKALKQAHYEDMAKEEFENIHDLFAAILAKGIGLQIKRGLHREYLHQAEELATVRGKIDLQQTIRNRISKKHVINCEYDELSEDNVLNQILKATALLLIKHDRVDRVRKEDLKKVMLFFSNVSDVDLSAIKWTQLSFHRNNSTYQMLIGICRLVAEGMLLTKEKGVHKLAAFVDDEHMHKLYEAFILEYYKQEHPWIRIEPPEIQWDIDDGVFDRLPRMISDVTLTHGNKTLIIDAKYYSTILQQYYDAHTIRSMHLYQIYSYVKNKAAAFPHQEVSGLLLYARTDESIQPNDSYEMGGNTIGVQTLDLNKEFSSIAGELDEIARKFLIGEQFYG